MHPQEGADVALGSRIRDSREAAGLSREVLAVRAGISVSTLLRIENGLLDPRVSVLDALAREMGVTSVSLLAGPAPLGIDAPAEAAS